MATAAVVLAATVGACGRSGGSSDNPTTPANSGSTSASVPSSSVTAASGKGDFGDLKAICGPGTATGGSGRGISKTAIKVGTMADPGATVAPGLGKDFFDVADSFVKWCNDAGGINGRKLELTKYDAKYFNVAQQMISACQSEFMLVGNGNAADAPGARPRLACKLGEVPAYSVSPEAVASGLQVNATPNPANQFQVGPYRLLQLKYPAATKVSIGGSNIASLKSTGLRSRDAVEKIRLKVVDYSERPPLVTNYRPYFEATKQSDAEGYNDTTASDITPELTAAKNVGAQLTWWLLGNQFYDPKTIQAVKSQGLPGDTKIYQYFSHLPFELSDQFPVVKQIKDIMEAGVQNPKYTDFTALGFNAWVLWAKSATACGNDLTQDCVLEKAGGEKTWTAGGFFPARNTDPKNPLQPTCYVMMDVTANGFVYDKDVTQPNQSVYNCDPKNSVDLEKTYQ